MSTVIEEGYRSAPCGEVEHATCHICGAPCDVVRDVVGPTSWVEAMAKRRHRHDAIRCPHAGQDWHNRAVRLRRAIPTHPSARVRAVMREELKEMVVAGAAER